MKPLFLLAAPLALAACVTVYPPDEPSDGVAVARFGETVAVGRVRVTPVSLVEDSRCPQGVQCVWAGRVRIAARVDGRPLELTLGQPATLASGALTLVSVEPPRRRDAAPAPRDYRFGFRFAG